MASRVTSDDVVPSLTLHEEPEGTRQENSATVRLKLKEPQKKKKVVWSEGTVDNEEMNKKKSKCCCIYKKPRAYGESSSESEDDCDNCPGHKDSRPPPTPPTSVPPIA